LAGEDIRPVASLEAIKKNFFLYFFLIRKKFFFNPGRMSPLPKARPLLRKTEPIKKGGQAPSPPA